MVWRRIRYFISSLSLGHCCRFCHILKHTKMIFSNSIKSQIKGSYTLFILLSLLLGFSCTSNKTAKKEIQDSLPVAKRDVIDYEFINKETQARLTPDLVLDILKKRNQEYVDENLTIRNTSARIRKASLGQYPAAVILSCLDSRVPVEDVFHSGIGDLFVARLAGNIVDEEILGSLEYGCKVSGAKLIVVLGHEDCGAIKSAIKDVKLGNITSLLSKIRPLLIR
ncbi:MAG TPA: carbonic anhydrase [Daejeonella sp.]|nr:carbonic anhydrase [Daejeonella sp.]